MSFAPGSHACKGGIYWAWHEVGIQNEAPWCILLLFMVWTEHRRLLRALKDRHNSCLWLWPALCRRKYSHKKHSKAVMFLLSTCSTAGHNSQMQTTHIGVKDSWKDDQTTITKWMGAACIMLSCWNHGLCCFTQCPSRAPGGKKDICGGNRCSSLSPGLCRKDTGQRTERLFFNVQIHHC